MPSDSPTSEDKQEPRSAADRAMDELKARIESDGSLDAALKEGLLEDLTSESPAELKQFVSALELVVQNETTQA